jgi:hypothetical protein
MHRNMNGYHADLRLLSVDMRDGLNLSNYVILNYLLNLNFRRRGLEHLKSTRGRHSRTTNDDREKLLEDLTTLYTHLYFIYVCV